MSDSDQKIKKVRVVVVLLMAGGEQESKACCITLRPVGTRGMEEHPVPSSRGAAHTKFLIVLQSIFCVCVYTCVYADKG